MKNKEELEKQISLAKEQLYEIERAESIKETEDGYDIEYLSSWYLKQDIIKYHKDGYLIIKLDVPNGLRSKWGMLDQKSDKWHKICSIKHSILVAEGDYPVRFEGSLMETFSTERFIKGFEQ